MKMTLIVPEEFKLAGSDICVAISALSGSAGEWLGGQNAIRIDSSLCDQMKVEVFFHELSEAISAKFVNEQAGGDPIDHRIVDAYGRGMFDFFVNNVSKILRVDNGKKRSEQLGEPVHEIPPGVPRGPGTAAQTDGGEVG